MNRPLPENLSYDELQTKYTLLAKQHDELMDMVLKLYPILIEGDFQLPMDLASWYSENRPPTYKQQERPHTTVGDLRRVKKEILKLQCSKAPEL